MRVVYLKASPMFRNTLLNFTHNHASKLQILTTTWSVGHWASLLRRLEVKGPHFMALYQKHVLIFLYVCYQSYSIYIYLPSYVQLIWHDLNNYLRLRYVTFPPQKTTTSLKYILFNCELAWSKRFSTMFKHSRLRCVLLCCLLQTSG